VVVKAFAASGLPHLASTRGTRDRLDLVTDEVPDTWDTRDTLTRLAAGMSVLVGPGETHWFEKDSAADFSFVEFWAPPSPGRCGRCGR
jgi:hypothetical protein